MIDKQTNESTERAEIEQRAKAMFVDRINAETVVGYGREYCVQYAVDFAETEIAELRKQLAAAEAVIDHYSDDSFWDDPHPDLRYSVASLYNFEDDFKGAIPGYFVAREYREKYPAIQADGGTND